MTRGVLIAQYREVTVRQEGTRVLVIADGRAVLDLPWEGGLAVAKALYRQSRKAEELAKAGQIVMDEAILLRSGAPVSLTANPDIRAEAKKEAAWNSRLRRYMRVRTRRGPVYGPVVRHQEE